MTNLLPGIHHLPPEIPRCSVANCSRPSYRRTWCNAHYCRWKRYGSPIAGPRAMKGSGMAWLRNVLASPAHDHCDLWPFSQNGRGYGQVRLDGRLYGAHRLSLTLAKGEPADGLCEAAHDPAVCNNRLCCNPKHLRWASHAENIADKEISDTTLVGEAHQNARLTEADVLEIRASDASHATLARKFDVSIGAVSHVRKGTTWRHVEGPK